MASKAATFPNVTAFNARVFPPGDYRRAAVDYRRVVGGVVTVLAAIAAVGLMIGTVTVAAAWIVAAAFTTDRNLQAGAPMALEMAFRVGPHRRLVDAPNMSVSSPRAATHGLRAGFAVRSAARFARGSIARAERSAAAAAAAGAAASRRTGGSNSAPAAAAAVRFTGSGGSHCGRAGPNSARANAAAIGRRALGEQ